jgi:hypothetical protein
LQQIKHLQQIVRTRTTSELPRLDCNPQMYIVVVWSWGALRPMGGNSVKILKIFSSAMVCAVGLAALSASAKANIIPVVDPHFDQFPAGPTHPPNFPAGFLVGPGAPNPYLYFSCGGTCRFADDNVVGWTSSETYNLPHALSG